MLNMQHITADKIKEYADLINRVEFRFITGYPSIIHAFAQQVEESGLQIRRVPEWLFPGAEKLYAHQAEQITRVFPGIRIMEHYGFSEQAACASKCLHGHYHEDYELGHMEVDHPQRTADGTGQTGVLLATGFQNMAMPFIRYEVGDTVTLADAPCSCGLHSRVITDIEGRSEDYVLTPEGSRIMRFDYIFKDTRSIKECQVVQREAGGVVLRIVRRPDYDSRTEQSLLQAIKEQISPTLQVRFEYVDEIPRTRAGKFRAVVSELK